MLGVTQLLNHSKIIDLFESLLELVKCRKYHKINNEPQFDISSWLFCGLLFFVLQSAGLDLSNKQYHTLFDTLLG